MNESTIPLPTLKILDKPVVERKQAGHIIKVRYLNMIIGVERPNNFVLLRPKSQEIVEISRIVMERGMDALVYGKEWTAKTDIFNFPCASSTLKEWEIDKPSDTEESWKLEEIKCKLFYCSISRKNYAISILHTDF